MKNLLIVGASSGIGEKIAKRFLQKGSRVINISRRNSNLSGIKNYSLDVTDRTALDKALDEIIETEEIDSFIYCAGFSMASPLKYVEEGDYRYLFEVNYFAFLHCLYRLLPTLDKNNGRVAIIGSVASEAVIPFDCYYSSSKAALNALVLALRQEFTGVKIFAALPGGTKTRFTYKRKVYPVDSVYEYADKMTKACVNLAKIEQNGMTADSVAKSVVKNFQRKNPRPIIATGFINKFTVMAVRFMPLKLTEWIIKMIMGRKNSVG